MRQYYLLTLKKKEAISGYIRSLVGLKKYDAAENFIESIDDKLKDDNLVKDAIEL